MAPSPRTTRTAAVQTGSFSTAISGSGYPERCSTTTERAPGPPVPAVERESQPFNAGGVSRHDGAPDRQAVRARRTRRGCPAGQGLSRPRGVEGRPDGRGPACKTAAPRPHPPTAPAPGCRDTLPVMAFDTHAAVKTLTDAGADVDETRSPWGNLPGLDEIPSVLYPAPSSAARSRSPMRLAVRHQAQDRDRVGQRIAPAAREARARPAQELPLELPLLTVVGRHAGDSPPPGVTAQVTPTA